MDGSSLQQFKRLETPEAKILATTIRAISGLKPTNSVAANAKIRRIENMRPNEIQHRPINLRQPHQVCLSRLRSGANLPMGLAPTLPGLLQAHPIEGQETGRERLLPLIERTFARI
jgi:hypothetical protein